MRTALVTGSAGFIGRHVSRALADEGYSVECVDVKHGGTDCRVLFRPGMNLPRFDLVVHCAAVVGGRAKIEGQPMEVAVDLSIDAEMWQWALRSRPGRVVYYSSSAAYPVNLQGLWENWAYGKTNRRRLHEGDIDLSAIEHPDATYGLAKLVGEVQAELVRAEGVPVTVLRPFSGYGEDQDLTYPMPTIAARAARRQDPLVVWGSGEQQRDWIHVDDVVGATMACVEQGVDGPLNLGSGEATSFIELAQRFSVAANYRPDIECHRDMPEGVHRRVSDNTEMLHVYTPKVTLDEGVARMYGAAMVAMLKETT